MRECCSVDECCRPIFRGEYCGAHHKRVQRNKTVSGLVRERISPEERVLKTGDEWLQASAEDDGMHRYKRAAFLRAAAAWLKYLGWKPPPPGYKPPRGAR